MIKGSCLCDAVKFEIAASALDDDPGIRPTEHLNVASKPDWYEIDDHLKKVEGNYKAGM